MPVPFGVRFDRYAQTTGGNVAIGLGPVVHVNGVALVTGFLFAEIWNYCSDPVTTTWTAIALPSTTWTDNNPSNPTTWSVMG